MRRLLVAMQLLLIILSLTTPCIVSAELLSIKEFNKLVEVNGFPPPKPEIYPHLIKEIKHFSRNEIAMFLSQLIHESIGFQYTEEIICTTGNHCAGQYVDNVGLPGKSYYGRGYIQLTWGANYKAASEGLGMGDKLLRHPEIVATDTKIAVLVSVWYWKARVRPQLVGKENQFGVTTDAINGELECSHGKNDRAENRYKIYLKVANVMKIKHKAVENGCYD